MTIEFSPGRKEILKRIGGTKLIDIEERISQYDDLDKDKSVVLTFEDGREIEISFFEGNLMVDLD